MADRVRAQNLGMDYTILGQGVPFLHAGVDMLRSKSMDRDSFDSGDWFNRLDFTYGDNSWAAGLPVAGKNQDNWHLIGPRLADPALDPDQPAIEGAVDHLRELLTIRQSSPLFRLTTEDLITERLAFHNTGSAQVPGLVVMTIADPGTAPLPSGDLDPEADGLVVLLNATDDPVSYELPATVGADVVLHPTHETSADPVVRTATFDTGTGIFEVPARTTAVFVDVQDLEPPVVDAELDRTQAGKSQGKYIVNVSCTDNIADGVVLSADINGVPVADGDEVQLVIRPGEQSVQEVPGTGVLKIMAPSFMMTVTCVDRAGNVTEVTVVPEFGP
jgi:hypothetical protein